jgi:hypothetical protein
MQIFGIELGNILDTGLKYAPFVLAALCFILVIVLHRRISTTGTVMLVMAAFLFIISGITSQLDFRYSDELSLGSYIMATFLVFMTMRESSGLSWGLLLVVFILAVVAVLHKGYSYFFQNGVVSKLGLRGKPVTVTKKVTVEPKKASKTVTIASAPTRDIEPVEPVQSTSEDDFLGFSMYDKKYKQVPPKNFSGIKPRATTTTTSSVKRYSGSLDSLFGGSSIGSVSSGSVSSAQSDSIGMAPPSRRFAPTSVESIDSIDSVIFEQAPQSREIPTVSGVRLTGISF